MAPSAQDNDALSGTRSALPDESKVNVRNYDRSPDTTTTGVLQVESGKYVYFNAPQLKEPTRPLADMPPRYPREKVDYPHGAVNLILLIDEQGKLEKSIVVCANPTFEAAALASVRGMRFNPGRDANGPVKTYMLVDFWYGTGAPCGPLPPTLQMELSKRAR